MQTLLSFSILENLLGANMFSNMIDTNGQNEHFKIFNYECYQM